MENLYRMSRALFPPHPEILSDMCQQGFDDTLKYLQNNSKLQYHAFLNTSDSVFQSFQPSYITRHLLLVIANNSVIYSYSALFIYS